MVHVRTCLTREVSDHNGDVIAVRVEGLQQPHDHTAAIHQPAWVLHLLGGGTPHLHPHVVETERVCDGCRPRAPWAVAAMKRLTEPLA